VLGLLYDIHGNLPALGEVLREAEAEGVDRWLLGGDYGTPSPWPLETLDRLKQLPDATWIRGNGERWLREPPEDRPEVMEIYEYMTAGVPEEVVEWLYA
jgi:predicted phosphodiesterase